MEPRIESATWLALGRTLARELFAHLAVRAPVHHQNVELIGTVLARWIEDVTPEDAPPVAAVPTRAPLPSPRGLSAREATALGSQLLAGGEWKVALPYLLCGVQAERTAFGFCRLGKALYEWQLYGYAVQAYDEALLLEPGNPYAVTGRGRAAARWPAATQELLLDALSETLHLVRHEKLSIVGRVVEALLHALNRSLNSPDLAAHARHWGDLARRADRGSERDRRMAAERSLDAALRARELLDGTWREPHALAQNGPRALLEPCD